VDCFGLRPGAALPAGQLVDVAVRRAKMAPTSAALIHLPPEELHAGCLQLPDGGGEIVDHEADDGTGGEVRVVLVAWAKHFERAAVRQLEGGEVGPFLAGGQPEDGLEECHHGGVLAGPRARPANALDPHACPLPAQVLRARDPATSPPTSNRGRPPPRRRAGDRLGVVINPRIALGQVGVTSTSGPKLRVWVTGADPGVPGRGRQRPTLRGMASGHDRMRRGELLGLRWTDIDLDAGVVRVAQARVRAGTRW
jgi:hypothetical protein